MRGPNNTLQKSDFLFDIMMAKKQRISLRSPRRRHRRDLHTSGGTPPTKGERCLGTNDSDRFGLVYVDFATHQRTPKLSAEWFREAAARNTVV